MGELGRVVVVEGFACSPPSISHPIYPTACCSFAGFITRIQLAHLSQNKLFVVHGWRKRGGWGMDGRTDGRRTIKRVGSAIGELTPLLIPPRLPSPLLLCPHSSTPLTSLAVQPFCSRFYLPAWSRRPARQPDSQPHIAPTPTAVVVEWRRQSPLGRGVSLVGGGGSQSPPPHHVQ